MNTTLNGVKQVAKRTQKVLAQKKRASTVTTTLYDLIAAVQDSVNPDEEELVVPTVVHMLLVGRATSSGDM